MASREPTREQLANELQLIKARQLQLQRQVRNLGYQAARVSKQLLDLSPAPKIETRQLR